MRQTPLSRLIELKLGRDLREHVVEARNAGHDWRKIATDLTERTDVAVSNETVRAWFADELVLVLRDSIAQPEPIEKSA